jgi:hypothetical protein
MLLPNAVVVVMKKQQLPYIMLVKRAKDETLFACLLTTSHVDE